MNPFYSIIEVMPSGSENDLNPYAPPKNLGDDEKQGRRGRFGKLAVEWTFCFVITALFVHSFVLELSIAEQIAWYLGAALSCVIPAYAAVSVHSRFRRGFIQSLMTALVSFAITAGLILLFYMLIMVL